MKTSLFALAVLVAMTTAALPQSRTFYDSTTGRVTGRSTTDSGGATTYYGADGRVTGRPATPRRSIRWRSQRRQHRHFAHQTVRRSKTMEALSEARLGRITAGTRHPSNSGAI